MINEESHGFRDNKDHFIPNEVETKNPLWVLPLNLKKISLWFLNSYLFSWNLVYWLITLFAYFFLTPSLIKMQSLSVDWILFILLRNYLIVVIFFSLIHIPLYIAKTQDIKFKFNPNWPEKKLFLMVIFLLSMLQKKLN